MLADKFTVMVGNTRVNDKGEEHSTATTNSTYGFRSKGWTFQGHKVTRYPHWVSSEYDFS